MAGSRADKRRVVSRGSCLGDSLALGGEPRLTVLGLAHPTAHDFFFSFAFEASVNAFHLQVNVLAVSLTVYRSGAVLDILQLSVRAAYVPMCLLCSSLGSQSTLASKVLHNNLPILHGSQHSLIC